MWKTKKNSILLTISIIFVLSLANCQQKPRETPTSGKLNVYVSDSHLPLVQREADVFNSLYADAHISLLTASTRECLVHLLNDSVRMVFTDRALNDEERQVIQKENLKIEEVKVAIDALALLVNHLNDSDNLTMAGLVDILDGKTTDWNQPGNRRFKGPIHLATTGKNSGAYELLKNHFLKRDKELSPSIILNSQAQVLEYVAKDPQALGVVSLACFKEDTLATLTGKDDGKVRPLAFMITDSSGTPARVTLHPYYLHSGEYPLHYPLYVYFNARSRLAAGFSAFIASAPGQKIILNWGLVPATMPVRFVQLQTR